MKIQLKLVKFIIIFLNVFFIIYEKKHNNDLINSISGHEESIWNGYQFPNLIGLPSLSNIGLAWPLAIKLNAFTVAKIILKLVIFKMIVKFMAVMCLLLFIPKLKTKKEGKDDDDEDDDKRSGKLYHSITNYSMFFKNLNKLVF